MSLSPDHAGAGSSDIHSPDIFMSGVRCNLNSRYLDVRDSTKEEAMCVYARIRPMLPSEEAKGYKECIAAVDEETVRVIVPSTSARSKSMRQSEEVIDFTFSAAFGPESGQFPFFRETMLSHMQNFVEGGNSLIFSYGITGSGKTYTLQGNSEDPGIIPLSLKLYFAAVEKQLFQKIKVKPLMYNSIKVLSIDEQKQECNAKKELLSLYDEECEMVPGSFRNSNSKTFAMKLCDLFSDRYEDEERETTLEPKDMASAQAATLMKEVIQHSAENQQGVCNVWVSFIEIYNENIFDLLQSCNSRDRKRLMLREHNGNVYIDGAREICVTNGDEALKVLNIGRKNLSIASTKLNYQSSRSHCIYTLRVVRVYGADDLSVGSVNRLVFCDLAGSERAAKTLTTGVRLKEAGSINTSLLVLGRCLEQLRMNQMGKEKMIIPFRESKLTRIFSGFFLGQGKAVMIANASPCHYTFDETLHVLKFSAIARKLRMDTFISTSTLQNIRDQWSEILDASRDESFQSDDSNWDAIIQKKDEIIEKLLEVADNLTKQQENISDMEMRIRREVCQEYSEYSDQLLEERRLMYEAMMANLREKHRKAMDRRDKLYEKHIEKLMELDEESEEESINQSNSQMDFENSATVSTEETTVGSDSTCKSKRTNQSQNEELKELQSTLESVTSELEKVKQELSESKASITNLDIELNICKIEKEKLSKEIANYRSAQSEAVNTSKKYECDMKNLEEEITSLRKELSSAVEFGKEKEFDFHEMKSENENLKNEFNTLKGEMKDYQKKVDDCNLEKENYLVKISNLEEELISNENKFKEQMEIKCSNASTLKKGFEEMEEKMKTLMAQNTNYEEKIKEYNLESESNKDKISNLENKLLSKEKCFEELLKSKLSAVSDIENELKTKIDEYLSKIEELNKVNQKYEDNEQKLKSNIQLLEKRLCSLETELSNSVKQKEFDSTRTAELEKELKRKNEEWKLEIGELNKLNKKYKDNEEKLKSEIQLLEERLRSNEIELCSIIKSIEADSTCTSVFERDVDVDVKEEENMSNSKRFSDSSFVNYVDKLREMVFALQQELHAKNKDINALRKEVKIKETVLLQLEKEIEMRNEEISILNQKSSENVELQNKLVSIGQELKDKTDTCMQMSAQLTQLKIQVELQSENLSDNAEFENKLTSVLQELEDKKNAHVQMSDQLNELKIKKDTDDNNWNVKVDNLKMEKEALTSENKDLKEKLLVTETKLKDTEQESDDKLLESITEINTWKLKLDNLKMEKEDLTSENKDLKKKLLVTETKLKVTEQKKEKLLESIAELELQSNKISDNAELENKLASVLQELEDKKNTCIQVSDQLNELKLKKDAEDNTWKFTVANLEMEKENLTSENKDLKEKLLVTETKLKDAEEKNEKQLESIAELELQSKKISDNAELDNKLTSVSEELENKKNDCRQMLNQLDELKIKNDAEVNTWKLKVDDLKVEKDNLISENKAIKEKLLVNENKLKDIELKNEKLLESIAEVDLKSKKLSDNAEFENKLTTVFQELEDKKNTCIQISDQLNELKIKKDADDNSWKVKVANLTMEKEDLISENKHLNEILLMTETKLKDTEQKNEKLLESIADDNSWKVKVANLKMEKEDLISENKDLKEKLLVIETKLKDTEQKNEKLLESIADAELQKEKIETLSKKISENTELENKLASMSQELENAKNTCMQMSEQLSEVQKELTVLYDLIQILQECEIKAHDKIKAYENMILDLKYKMKDLNLQIQNKEASIEVLEKAVSDSQEQLKSIQMSYDQKLSVINEQHEIEISETMKLKHEVEEENLNLKKQRNANTESGENSLPDGKRGAKQSKSNKGKENLSENTARSLRRTDTKLLDSSLESIDFTPEVRQKSRKRVSDEDFVPDSERGAKRSKPAPSKIPVTRLKQRKIGTKKKTSEPSENLSPLQKFTSSIATKMRAISNSIPAVPSPRITRGRKKLFNPEASAAASRGTRGKKS